MDRGDFSAAESLLAEGDSSNHNLARLRGQLALKRGDGRAAVPFFRLALAGDPVDRVALHGLGTALRQLGDDDAAKPYIEAASRHDELWRLVVRASTPEGENDPKMPHQLGMACAAAGRNQEARAWLKLAIERDPLDSEGQRTLFDLEHNVAPRSSAQESTAPAGTRINQVPCRVSGSAHPRSERRVRTSRTDNGRIDLEDGVRTAGRIPDAIDVPS